MIAQKRNFLNNFDHMKSGRAKFDVFLTISSAMWVSLTLGFSPLEKYSLNVVWSVFTETKLLWLNTYRLSLEQKAIVICCNPRGEYWTLFGQTGKTALRSAFVYTARISQMTVLQIFEARVHLSMFPFISTVNIPKCGWRLTLFCKAISWSLFSSGFLMRAL